MKFHHLTAQRKAAALSVFTKWHHACWGCVLPLHDKHGQTLSSENFRRQTQGEVGSGTSRVLNGCPTDPFSIHIILAHGW